MSGFAVPPEHVLTELRARAAATRRARFEDPVQLARIRRLWQSDRTWCIQVLGFEPGLAAISSFSRRAVARGRRRAPFPTDLPALQQQDVELLDLAAHWSGGTN